MHKKFFFLPLVVFLFGSEGSEGTTLMVSDACSVILFLPLCLPKNPLLLYNYKTTSDSEKKRKQKVLAMWNTGYLAVVAVAFLFPWRNMNVTSLFFLHIFLL